MNTPNIIVGEGIGGKENIIHDLLDSGYTVKDVGPRMWPRDHYVHFRNRYLTSEIPGFPSSNSFGEGGNVLPAKDFLLVSDGIRNNHTIIDN